MYFKDLAYIVCIAKHRSITKAAEELYISQPSLSKFLKRLESNLGVQLFHHIGGQFTPTYAGERYLEYINRIIDIKESWEGELRQLKQSDKGQLTIAFPLWRSFGTIPDTLPVFRKLYPNIQVNLLEEAYDVEGKLLHDDKVDIAIYNKISDHPKLEYKCIGHDEILLLIHENHPLACKGERVPGCHYPWISLKHFVNENFILLNSELTTGIVATKLFKENNFTPKVVFRTRNVALQAKMASEGIGVCFINESYYKLMDFQHQPLCFSIGSPSVTYPLVIAYRKGAYLPPYVYDYMELTSAYYSGSGSATAD